MTYNAGAETLFTPESTNSATALSAGSLKDLVGRIGKKILAKFVARHTDDGLETEIVRLAELSPHLLLDIGVDPTTGDLIQRTELPIKIITVPQIRAASKGDEPGTIRLPSNAKVPRPRESVAPSVAA